MRSMTGFGQATAGDERRQVTVTLRSVNHRFLEVRLRLPDEARASEAAVQELFAEELFRGRVEAAAEARRTGERAVEVEVDRQVVMAAHAAFEELVGGGLLAQQLTAGDLLRLPEAVTVRTAADRWEEADHALLVTAARAARDQLVGGREAEGEKLARALGERLDELAAVAADLAGLADAARSEAAAGLAARVEELLAAAGSGARLDPGRLEQELALLADRGDVREELDRLAAHLEHFRELVAAPGAVGKRLDFLTQEVLRELNTLGAKCRNAAMTRRVLDGKVLVEQLREQVQNVE
ncbi:MAG TPA: YicC/YloC family endoribonuclease [Thermoanaerobaculia bacterium]|nr:YicC/YloC family endoribonuclease [Thermoanaerobaculia bacterium]